MCSRVTLRKRALAAILRCGGGFVVSSVCPASEQNFWIASSYARGQKGWLIPQPVALYSLFFFFWLDLSYMYCLTCNAYTLGFWEESERNGGQKSTPQMGLFGQHKIYTNWSTFDDIWVIYLFIGSYPPLVFNRLWEAYKTAKSEKWLMLCVLTQILD